MDTIKYYAEEVIEFNGKEYSPITDTIHKLAEGVYTNEVKDKEGNKYRAHYTQKHLDNDDWSQPIGLWQI